MTSGIRSLCSTHEQIILAWTGDIESGAVGGSPAKGSKNTLSSGTRNLPTSSITEDDKALLESEITNYQSPLDKENTGKRLSYVPVFLDDKIAHGHYEGYCKTSKFSIPFYTTVTDSKFPSSLAPLPLPPLARCRHRTTI